MKRTTSQLLAGALALGIGVSVFMIPSASTSPFSGPFGGGAGGGLNGSGDLCINATCTTYLTAADGGVTVVGAPLASRYGFADGTLANASQDVYGNTFVAQATGEDGGVGTYGYICEQNPCRAKLSAGVQSELISSDNSLTFNYGLVVLPTTTISQPGNPVSTNVRWIVQTTGTFFGLYPTSDTTGCGAPTDDNGGLRYVSTDNTLRYCDGTVLQRVTSDKPSTLPTCGASLEGRIVVDGASGGTSGARTQACLCTSDGAGSPAYAWQNLVSGTVGTTTTCAP